MKEPIDRTKEMKLELLYAEEVKLIRARRDFYKKYHEACVSLMGLRERILEIGGEL